MQYMVVTKCWHNNTLWMPGQVHDESIIKDKKGFIPKHFKAMVSTTDFSSEIASIRRSIAELSAGKAMTIGKDVVAELQDRLNELQRIQEPVSEKYEIKIEPKKESLAVIRARELRKESEKIIEREELQEKINKEPTE